MIGLARTRPTEGSVSFVVGDTADLDEPGSFDAVFSRFGVMFFDDPVASFAHLRDVGATEAGWPSRAGKGRSTTPG